MSGKPALSVRDRVLTAILAWCFDRLGPVARARVADAMPLAHRNRSRQEGQS